MNQINQSIYQDHQELFDLAQEIQQFTSWLLGEFNQKQIKLFDFPAHQRIFLFIVTRSIKTYDSIVALCQAGYGQDVAPLLRSLLENLITAKYILNDQRFSDNLAKRFVAYKWIIFKRQLAEQEKQLLKASSVDRDDFEQRKKMILERVEEFKRTFKVTSDQALLTWSGRTVRDMAQQVDMNLLEEYEKTFRLCSRFSHPTILGDNEYMVQEDNRIVFSSQPSHIGIAANLKHAMKYILDFQEIIDRTFNVSDGQRLQKIKDALKKIAGLEKYKQDLPSLGRTDVKNPSIKESIIQFKVNAASKKVT